MKRIYLCSGIFAALIAYSLICQTYVSRTVGETVELLGKAGASSEDGDYAASRQYVESAARKWNAFVNKGSYVLVDFTLVADISVSVSRVEAVAKSGDNENRFTEECAATVILMKKFLSDNENFLRRRLEK